MSEEMKSKALELKDEDLEQTVGGSGPTDGNSCEKSVPNFSLYYGRMVNNGCMEFSAMDSNGYHVCGNCKHLINGGRTQRSYVTVYCN